MNKTCFFFVLILVLTAGFAAGQDTDAEGDRYLQKYDTVVVAECLSVGPVNILLRADVRLRVLLLVKGKQIPNQITVDSQIGMTPGSRYLVAVKTVDQKEQKFHRVDRLESVIEIDNYTDLAELGRLSPRIIVLRTINLRLDRIENEIRHLQNELAALKAVRKDD